jgi:hypothetical protein
MSQVSLLFAARNRLEFTRQSWAALMANTDWSLVSEFHVYDDGSEDGTSEWLGSSEAHEQWWHICTEPTWHFTSFASPMAVTIDWIRKSRAPILAKCDNDAIYPTGWLNTALDVMDCHRELKCLGLECMREPLSVGAHGFEFLDGHPIPREQFGYLTAPQISGLGLYRREIFDACKPDDGGYFGLEEFLVRHKIHCGWILPSMPVFLLDRLPMEPWLSLSERYVRLGWQRKWSLDLRYRAEESRMWDWWRPV